METPKISACCSDPLRKVAFSSTSSALKRQGCAESQIQVCCRRVAARQIAKNAENPLSAHLSLQNLSSQPRDEESIKHNKTTVILQISQISDVETLTLIIRSWDILDCDSEIQRCCDEAHLSSSLPLHSWLPPAAQFPEPVGACDRICRPYKLRWQRWPQPSPQT